MERSPYLAQALQGMAQPAPQAQPAPDLAQMAGAARQRQAWEAANPGQNYARHQLGALMAGVKAAPGNVMSAPANLAGLLGLGRR